MSDEKTTVKLVRNVGARGLVTVGYLRLGGERPVFVRAVDRKRHYFRNHRGWAIDARTLTWLRLSYRNVVLSLWVTEDPKYTDRRFTHYTVELDKLMKHGETVDYAGQGAQVCLAQSAWTRDPEAFDGLPGWLAGPMTVKQLERSA